MLSLYYSLNEFASAEKFIAGRGASPAVELYFVIDVLLELGKLQEARTVARKCKEALASCKSSAGGVDERIASAAGFDRHCHEHR